MQVLGLSTWGAVQVTQAPLLQTVPVRHTHVFVLQSTLFPPVQGPTQVPLQHVAELAALVASKAQQLTPLPLRQGVASGQCNTCGEVRVRVGLPLQVLQSTHAWAQATKGAGACKLNSGAHNWPHWQASRQAW